MLPGIINLLIHSEHDGYIFVFRGSRDDDFLHRPAQVLFRILSIGETARGLKHYLGAD